MKTRNTSVPTRYKKYQYNWYAVAAVATALQMSVGFEEDISTSAESTLVNIDDIIRRGSPNPSTTAFTPFDQSDLRASVSTTLVTNDAEEDFDDIEDFAIKPKYVKEFKIKVGSLKIDKSLPKIFVD